MNRQLERLIPLALEAAQTHLAQGRDKKSIPSEYSGYIAAFGAAVIQSGLLPAIAFFQREKADSAQDKKKLTRAILHILSPGKPETATLLDHALAAQDPRALKQEVLTAATALKLAIRTFKLDKEGN